MVKFSICIPAYKSRYLQLCIESILKQTLTDFELIILNDCSPESVDAIVQQFGDKRIKYFKNDQNVGAIDLVKNWNKCLSLATGEYIMIMGDDDLLAPDYLEEFSKLIDLYPALHVFHCRSKVINDTGETIMLTPAHPTFEHVYDSIWHRLEQYRSNYISDFIYHTANLRKQGGFFYLPLAWGSDDITAFIASRQNGIAHTNKPIFYYRSNALSITSTGNDLYKMEANMGYSKWLQNFLAEKPVDEDDLVVYQHLTKNQDRLMQKRKRYTMILSMRSNRLKKIVFWYRNRKQFGIDAKDILMAAIKSLS